MIVEPELRVADFAKAGADIISIHCEQSSTTHLDRVLNQVSFFAVLLARRDSLPDHHRSKIWGAKPEWC